MPSNHQLIAAGRQADRKITCIASVLPPVGAVDRPGGNGPTEQNGQSSTRSSRRVLDAVSARPPVTSAAREGLICPSSSLATDYGLPTADYTRRNWVKHPPRCPTPSPGLSPGRGCPRSRGPHSGGPGTTGRRALFPESVIRRRRPPRAPGAGPSAGDRS